MRQCNNLFNKVNIVEFSNQTLALQSTQYFFNYWSFEGLYSHYHFIALLWCFRISDFCK